MLAQSLAKNVALYVLKGLGAFWLARRLTRRKLRILCYHGFSVGDQYEFAPILYMRKEVFRQRMRLLRKLNARVVTLSHGIALLRSNAVQRGEVVITIDDGWKTTMTHGVPVLAEFSLPACLYVTTYYAQRAADVFNVVVRYIAWKTSMEDVTLSGIHPALDGRYRLKDNSDAIATEWISKAEQYLSWQQRQELISLLCRALALDPQTVMADNRFRLMDEQDIARCRHFNLDVQLHTHRHSLPTTAFDDMAPEVTENRTVLERIKHAGCTHLCYPSGIYGPDHAAWLAELGLDSATTCDPGLNTPATPRFLLKRHLDRDDASNIEFEAEICGVLDIARSVREWVTGGPEPKADPTIA
jgi:peptidoglycan/xylan/chitin deacetylase (PgdA/CDA1 family)